jgi:hypothetical protein
MKLPIPASFLAAASALSSTESERSSSLISTFLACNALKLAFSNDVFSPGDANYTAENQREPTPQTGRHHLMLLLQTSGHPPITSLRAVSSYPIQQWLLHARLLHSQISTQALRYVEADTCPFQVMRTPLGGVLIALTNLNAINLSSDKSYVSVGPGRRWEEVHAYLEPYGLVVLGGRVGNVGVPGLLLGGGISFYSNQYGFASDNVIEYEVSLYGEYRASLTQSFRSFSPVE